MPNALEWVTGVGQVGGVVFAAWAARSAANSADAARDGLKEQSRPFLVPSHEGPTLDIPGGKFSLGVRNVGRGAARLLGYRLRVVGEVDKQYRFLAPIEGTVAVSVGEDATLREPLVPPELGERLAQIEAYAPRGIGVWIDYVDYAGDQRQWIEFRVVAPSAGASLVVQSTRTGEYTPDASPESLTQPPKRKG